MEIHAQYIVPVLFAIFMYCFSVLLRFGSNLTKKSELIALGITAIPVIVGLLRWFNVIKVVW